MKKFLKLKMTSVAVAAWLFPVTAYAAGGGKNDALVGEALLAMATALLIAVLFAALANKKKIPLVLGWIIAGTVINTAVVNLVPWGSEDVAKFQDNILIYFMAFLGINILLFKAGLEENLQTFRKSAGRSLLVAFFGMVLPFAGVTLASMFMFDAGWLVHATMGATMTATSVGVPLAIFSAKRYKTETSTMTKKVGIIDDVGGLWTLAIIAEIVKNPHPSTKAILMICLKTGIFFGVALVGGWILTQGLTRLFKKIHTGAGVKVAIVFFVLAVGVNVAHWFGLEGIIGAFTFGLMLNSVEFDGYEDAEHITKMKGWEQRILLLAEKHNQHESDKEDVDSSELKEVATDIEEERKRLKHHQLEELVTPFEHQFTPLFFFCAGLYVDLTVLFQSWLSVIALIVFSIVGYYGKFFAAYFAGKGINIALLGHSMAIRGAVGFLFVAVAKKYGIFDAQWAALGTGAVFITTYLGCVMAEKCIDEERKTAQAKEKASIPA